MKNVILIILAGVLLYAFLGLAIFAILSSVFEGCAGLQDALNQIWTGVRCNA